jgi:hypothetical protein
MELKDLKELAYGELVQLHQSGQIGFLQFIMAQDDLAEMFANSCSLFGISEPTEEIARQWYEHHANTLEENQSNTGDELDRFLAG